MNDDQIVRAEAPPDSRRIQPGPLRRNWRFQCLWIGSGLGYIGIEAADIGYPLAILALTGSPATAGAFGAVQLMATLLTGLPAGAIADRYDRRRILITVETVRASAAAGSVVVALLIHHLTWQYLIAVAAVLGACAPFSGTTRLLMVRAVVPAEQLTAALTQEQVRDSVSQLIGPPLGGFLYGLRQLLPFLASVVGFAASLLSALVVRLPVREPSDARSSALAGLRTIWRNPTLRAATLLVATMNTVGAPLILITTVTLTRQHAHPWQIGTAMAGLAVGGLLGAALVGPLHRRFRPGTLLIGVATVEVPLVVCLGVPLGPWWIGLVLMCAGIGVPALQVLVDVLIFRQVPDNERGRVIAAVITLFGVGMPLGTLLSGFLLQYFPPQNAMLILAGILALGAGYSATRRELRTTRWPQAQD